ncbi:MAG: hypothetical protein IT389_15620 [Nitrospira sp.]|nr:hypothetical protein [Nitrospira sp.]
MWEQLISGATALRLPTGFLKAMPPDFVRFEFDDLRTYAAEYHPGEHRMVLNRTLSFHAAGRDVRSLTTMTPKELEVLYHELFHAYIDYLESREASGALPDSERELIAFAREMQVCRYREVSITPVVQRIHEAEVRYLSDPEAWEALNETWAVFVGWAVWNQLEIERKGGRSMKEVAQLSGEWVSRFRRAIEAGELRGYYVPQDPEERRVTQKRFLAPGSRISKEESRRLMKQVLGLPEKFIETAESALGQIKNISVDQPCPAVAP